MDTQIPAHDPIQPVAPIGQSEIPPVSVSSRSFFQSKKMLVLLIMLLLAALLGAGHYLAGKEKAVEKVTVVKKQESIPMPTTWPTTVPTIVPTRSPLDYSLADWKVNQSAMCHVGMSTPPKKVPYMENDGNLIWSWQFSEGTNAQIFDLTFEKTAVVQYFNDKGLGSGHTIGMVSVFCSSNANKYTTKSYADYVMESVKKRDMFMGENIICQPTQTPQTIWKKDVLVVVPNCKTQAGISVMEDAYYIFATESTTYVVQKQSDDSRAFVQETTETIFKELRFRNNEVPAFMN